MLLNAAQRAAVDLALTAPFGLLTGGPGTGKTTTLRAVVRELRTRREPFLLLAPTGKAASRLSSQTGAEASTIHRALGWDGERGAPRRNAQSPLEARVVVVDEASMVDSLLLARLLEALPSGARLLLVGDRDQLPPVSPGAPFRDLLAWDHLPTVRLTESYRQGPGSAVAEAARRVLRGEVPPAALEDPGGGFWFVERDLPADTAATAFRVATDRIPGAWEFDGEEVQTLTPRREGVVSVAGLNPMLAEHYNPGCEPDRISVGDRVLQTKNNYDLATFNGDMGVVLKRHPRGGLTVRFGERLVIYSATLVERELVRAYAITVHRSQGSEWPAVVIALGEGRILTRELLYTALTRAQRVAVIVGSRAALRRCVATPRGERLGLLQHRLALAV